MNNIAETKIISYFLAKEELRSIIEIDIKYFQVKFHKEIHRKITQIDKKGGLLSTASLIVELNRDSDEDTAITISEMIADIIRVTFTSPEVFDLEVSLEQLSEAYIRSEGIELALKIQKIAIDKTLNTTEIINAVKEMSSKFVENVALDEQYPLTYLSAAIDEKLCSLEKGEKAVSTGVKALDDITQGFAPKELIVLGGRPSDGKTYTGLVLADNIVKSGKPAVFFSAEMSKADLASRYIAKDYFEEYSEIFPSSKLAGLVPLTDEDKEKLVYVCTKRESYPFLIQDKPGCSLTLADIKKDLLTTKNEYGEIGIVVIDYLQLIAKSENSQLLTYAIGDLLNGLKLLAYDFNCPFLLLAQLNTRNVSNRGDKRPYPSDLSDSAQLEKYANKILLLHRECKYNPDADPSDLEIIVAKNRSGSEGTVKCSFDMRTGILQAVN